MSTAESNDVDFEQQRKKEFTYFKEKLAEFMSQNPKNHPLFEYATGIVPKNESAEFYRGYYASLTTVMRVIASSQTAAVKQLQSKNQVESSAEIEKGEGEEKIEKTQYEELWQATMHDMIKLSAGVTMSRLLYSWPAEHMVDSADQ